jgi:hypothetical protein
MVRVVHFGILSARQVELLSASDLLGWKLNELGVGLTGSGRAKAIHKARVSIFEFQTSETPVFSAIRSETIISWQGGFLSTMHGLDQVYMPSDGTTC